MFTPYLGSPISFPVNTRVRLEVVPFENWTFGNWSGDVTGNKTKNSTIIIMSRNKNIVANFNRIEYKVMNINVYSPRGCISDEYGRGCYIWMYASDGGGYYTRKTKFYPVGEIVNLEAQIHRFWRDNYTFVNWTGSISSNNPEIQIEMDTDKSVIAHFREI